ncbi:immunoglobulin-like domain-containing protein [Colwellia sp. 12G3]|uniref:immunoglobulin-like domain-containing protein n=1 Tax=Colwellia sp. 12G3 TaxID=2058299 RepID=UPI0012FE92A1|nr:immunoglobulin-like domain-containing protein [Colwellia sp. 12G3]
MKDLTAHLKTKYLPILLVPFAIAITGCGSDSDPTPTPMLDTVAPVITITGEKNITIFQNTTYADQGATATDAVDGSVAVVTTGTVNEAVVGEYVLTYSSEDMAGNDSTSTRTVTVTPVTISGTAAGGAAIVGTVVVKGSLGVVKSSVIEADGSYEVDVTGLTAPYRLRAEGTVGGKSYKLHSYTEEASVGGTVNITPFTDLIIANTAHQLAESFFDSNIDTTLSADELDAQEDALQVKLQNVFDALGLDTAINLLNSSFSADHSGVDAALDLINIETGDDNIATITNLLDNTSITDDITDSDDNDVVIEVDTGGVVIAVTDTIAITNIFAAFTSEFSDGLPTRDDIEGYFSDEFINEDGSRNEFLTDILTDPDMIGISFISLAVNNLDSDAGTAMVSFSVSFNGKVDHESEQWFVTKDETLGWQLLGDQKIVELNDLNYHCNDYDGADEFAGACGINTSFEDNDLDNNGTGGEPILSASVAIISGEDGSVKDMFYIGTASTSSQGHIYNEAEQQYTWDWREFGTEAGQIDPSIFSVGDTIEYNLYQANLDLTDPANPAIVGQPLVTYSNPVNYEPQTVGKYPEATQATIDNMSDFTFGEDITIAWTLAEGTNISEVLVQIDDPQGNWVLGVWDEINDSSATSQTIDAAMFDEELLGNDSFDPTNGYTVIVRIYAEDSVTGQDHSTDYRVMVPASTSGGDGTTPTTLTCNYESGWNDLADFELGAPITPNSFADFNEVVAACGGTNLVTKANIAGTTLLDNGESTMFNDDNLATEASPSTGQFIDGAEVIDFTWYIDTVNNSTYIIVESNSDLDSDLPAGFWLRETRAITNVVGTLGETGTTYKMIMYSEQSNYSDDDRAVGDDGEIWNSLYTVE